jgi:hypothetical protein
MFQRIASKLLFAWQMHTGFSCFILGLHFPVSFKQWEKIVTLKTEIFVAFIF